MLPESESQGLTYLEALVNRVPVIAKKNDYLSGLITADALECYLKQTQILPTVS